MVKCILCNLQVADPHDHITKECQQRTNLLSEIRSASASFHNGHQLCLHCMKQLGNRSLLDAHLKSCRRQRFSSRTKSGIPGSDQQKNPFNDEEQFIDPNPSKKVHQDVMQQQKISISIPYSYSNLSKHLLNIVLSHYAFIIEQFLKKNHGISNLILHQIFQQHLKSCYKYVQQLIPEVNLYNLFNKGQKGPNKISWKSYVKESTDLINQQLIKKRVQSDGRLQEEQRNRIYRYINDFIKKTNISIFQPFKVNKPEKLIQNQAAKPFLFDDLVIILKTLFTTQNKYYIHLGVDLLLMFVSGVRFPSSYHIIEKVIAESLQNERKKETITITLKSETKTKKKFILYYNAQVVSLLRYVNWTGFLLTKQQMQRISKIFPFKAYDLRRGYMNYIIEATNQKNITSLVGSVISQHKSSSNFQVYIRKYREEQLAKYKDKMVFKTDLTPQYEDQFVRSSFRRHAIELPKNWFDAVKKFISETFEKIDLDEKLKEKTEKYMQQQKHLQELQEEIEDYTSQQDESESESEEEIKIIKIEDRQYSFRKGRFYIQQLCSYENGAFVCNFCQSIVQKPQQFCHCMKFQRSQQRSSVKWDVNSKIKIIMPQNYTANEDYDQIRFLTYARNYFFTTVPVCSNQIKIQIPKTLGKLELPNFQDYISGKYFPPVKIGVYGQDYNKSPGFGIFASSYIQSGSLICQYAADMIFIQQERFVRRQDMIFRAGKNTKGKKISIAPIKYCGLGPLINSNMSNQTINCASGTFVVNGKSRILIYATEDIKTDQQLIYNYSRNQQKTQVILPKNTKLCRKKPNVVLIKNKNNRCYLIACIQIFSHLKAFIENQKREMKTEFYELFFNTIQKINLIIVIDEVAQLFFQRFNSFQDYQEEDTLNAFSSICNGLIDDQAIDLSFLKVQYVSTLECLYCKYQTQKKEQYFTITGVEYQNLSKESQPSQFAQCFKCKKKKLFTKGHWEIPSANKVIVFENKPGQKYHDTFMINGFVYKSTFGILRRGIDPRSGHIWCYNIQQQVLIDGWAVVAEKLKTNLLTIIIYVKQNNFRSIPEIPVVQFDVNDSDFEGFLIKQEKLYRNIGAIKVRLLNLTSKFNENQEKQILVKSQHLEKITDGVFVSKSTSLMPQNIKFLQNFQKNINTEEQFWNRLQQKSQIKVWYAPDQHQSGLTNFVGVKTTFNTIIKQEIIGINTPFIFYGTCGSFFGWHTQDYHLSAVNIHVFGQPKVWYIVPSSHFEEFRQFYQNYKQSLKITLGKDKQCQYPHLHKNVFVNPLFLFHRFPVFKVTQKFGEMILTFPKSSHWGFNLGFNVNQAFNVGDSSSWIQAFKDFKNCKCKFKIPPLKPSLLKQLKNFFIEKGREEEYQEYQKQLESNNIFE